MTTPCTGAIPATSIMNEFGGTKPFVLSQYYAGRGKVPPGIGSIPTSGPLAFSRFRCVSNTTAGERNFDVPGDFDFQIPPYRTMEVIMSGGSGGAGSSGWDRAREPEEDDVGPGAAGSAGKDSKFPTLVAEGGDKGLGQRGLTRWVGVNMPKGKPGGASGGDNNVPGGGQKGGVSAVIPSYQPSVKGGDGGDAGRCVKTFSVGSPGAPVAGTTVKLTVGDKGTGGPATGPGSTRGGDGVAGYVHIKWS